METTTVKFWKDAKVPEGAEYVGSINAGQGYDIYITDSGIVEWHGSDQFYGHTFEEVASYAIHRDWFLAALSLIAAHRAKAKQAPAPAPTLSRDDMILKAAQAGFRKTQGKPLEEAMDPAEHLKTAEVMLDAIGVLPPKPAPVEKSDNEKDADDRVKMRITDGRVDGVEFSLGDAKCAICRPSEPGFIEKVVGYARHSITQALDARDEQHRKELESLRRVCALVADDRKYPLLAAAIRDVPLTIAERKA